MPKQKTEDLVKLINSLTRAEKRHFRLFVRRNQASENILFLQLFDFLDKRQAYDEELLLRKIPEIKKAQLSNLKAHLYKQLLISMRLLNKQYNHDIQIREMIDYSRILYNKGLYQQALDSLSRAKESAEQHELQTQLLEILEFEKLIDGQYITRNIEDRSEQLTSQTKDLLDAVSLTHHYSNLSLQMYGLYLKVGFVRSEKDFSLVSGFFNREAKHLEFSELPFLGKVYYCQSYVWYYHMTLDFPMCYRYAQKWVDAFRESPNMIEVHAPLYLKGLHNVLNAIFNTLHYDRFIENLTLLYTFPKQYDLKRDKNIEGLYHLYYYIHNIKKHYLEGTFSEGLQLVPDLMKIIKTNRYNWDHHRIMVFYYRIACLYFGSGDNSTAVDYLNLIINQRNPDYRQDIQVFARILNLIAHFELGNATLVEYQVKSVYRFLSKMNDLHEVQKAIFQFLRRTPRMRRNEMRDEFIRLQQRLIKIEEEPYERRPFLYLDILSWLESKIEGCTVQEITQRKFQARQARQKESKTDQTSS